MTRFVRQRFATFAARDDDQMELARGALLIAAESCPAIDIDACFESLDLLAAEARPIVAAGETALERVARLNAFLFDEKGFVGNRSDYYDPRNSFLNEVLERRTGIPITLSVVWLEVARRLGLRACGIGFPGHFLVKALDDGEVLVDPFHGSIATREDCEQLLREALGERASLAPEHLAPVGTRQILARILANLKGIYTEREDWEAALACADRTLLLLPDALVELRDRGLIYARLECFRPALADLERFVELVGESRTSDELADALETLRERVQQIH